jgi:plastocyanin
MRPLHLALLLTVLALLASAPATALAGGGGNSGPCEALASGSYLAMRDSCFAGIAHFAEAGSTLEIYNEGELPHSFTAVDGSFDTGLLEAGESVKLGLGEAGLVRIYCSLHGTAEGNGMAGLLVIGEPAATLDAGPSAAALSRQNGELLTALEAQNAALTDLRAELAAVRQSVETRSADPRPAQATALGVLGTVLGGGALAAVVVRRREAPR